MSPLQAEILEVMRNARMALSLCQARERFGEHAEKIRVQAQAELNELIVRLQLGEWNEPPLPLTLARAMGEDVPLGAILHDRD